MDLTGVDLSPIWTASVNVLGTVLMGLISWVVYRIAPVANDWLGVQIEESALRQLDDALVTVLGSALAQAKKPPEALSSVQVRNPVLHTAAKEFARGYPALMARYRPSPGEIEKWLDARLNSDWKPGPTVPVERRGRER